MSVSIVMGSNSDREKMQSAVEVMIQHNIPHEVRVISAHRQPDETAEYSRELERRGFKVVIAGAGLSAALPGVVASRTKLPVIGVPLASGPLQGLDSLYSIVQMPPGVPVACMSINGAKNAGLFALKILGV